MLNLKYTEKMIN